MPVRAIKQIGCGYEDTLIVFPIPKSILTAYRPDHSGGIFVCLIVNHFDSGKGLVGKINERAKFNDICSSELRLSQHPLTKKYGFCRDEYLEVVFEEIEYSHRTGFLNRVKTTTIPIFPERMVEDLEFVPVQNNLTNIRR